MKDKEELLKAIEQKRQEVRPTDTGEMKPATVPNNLELGWLNALTWMKDLINSLPSEKSSEQLCWNDMTEEEKSDFFFDLSHQKQIEQPSEDFEEATIKEAHKRYGDRPPLNIGGDYEFAECHEEERELFIEGAQWMAQWQKEQIINKACKWLNENVVEYHPRTGKLRPIVNINAFREAMES